MKKLYDVNIIGQYSPNVESFFSVLHRLSIIHGVSITELLTFSIHHVNKRKTGYLHSSYSHRFHDLALLVRPNDTTRKLVDIVSLVTQNKTLRSTTFLALDEILDNSRKAFINKIKWCPICFYEFEQLGLDGYYKLIWSLKDVESCFIHNVRLVNKCHFCNSYQSTSGKRVPAIKCQNCELSLSLPLNEITIDDSWHMCDEGFLDLVQEIASNPNLTYPRKGIQNFVRSIFQHSFENNHEERLAQMICDDDSLRIISQNKPVTMITLRRLAYRLGLRLTYLLKGDTHYLQYSLNPDWETIYSDNLKPIPKIKHNHQHIFNELVEMKNSSKKFDSLKEICEELNVSSGYLYYRFPQLLAEVRNK